ncbi:hypothetical protein LTR17_013523 [Elasticomyces elasticus]|nr:hypothetical protein LTR17_013523 [Elasticomyces elasticus]
MHITARAASTLLSLTTPAPTVPHDALAVRQASVLEASSTTATNISLTTIFTPSPTCFDKTFGVMLDGTRSGNPSAFLDYSLAGSSCYPSSFSALQFQLSSVNAWYSPGVCPSGYLIASQEADSITTSVTNAWCCPSSMAYSHGANYAYCSSYVATSTTVRSGTYTTPVPFSGFVALQWPISVAWQEADLNAFSPASAPVLVATQTSSATSNTTQPYDLVTSTSSVSSSSTASATTISNPDSSGLSTGAEAGVGIGAGILCMALIGLGIWFWLRRRKAGRNARSETPSDEANLRSYGTKAELQGEEMRPYGTDKKRFQDGGHGDAAELESERDGLNELEEQDKWRADPVELPGDTVGELAAADVPSEPLKQVEKTEGQTAARKSSKDPLVDSNT